MHAQVVGWTLATSEQMTFRLFAKWALGHFKELLARSTTSGEIGLYVSTHDAGAEASVGFWREALAHGVDLANPANFPWTLASCPAGFFAMNLDIRGPNYTMVGRESASVAALYHALNDLESHRVERALVVRIDLTEHSSAAGLLLEKLSETDTAALLYWETCRSNDVSSDEACRPIIEMCSVLEASGEQVWRYQGSQVRIEQYDKIK